MKLCFIIILLQSVGLALCCHAQKDTAREGNEEKENTSLEVQLLTLSKDGKPKKSRKARLDQVGTIELAKHIAVLTKGDEIEIGANRHTIDHRRFELKKKEKGFFIFNKFYSTSICHRSPAPETNITFPQAVKSPVRIIVLTL